MSVFSFMTKSGMQDYVMLRAVSGLSRKSLDFICTLLIYIQHVTQIKVD